MGWFSIPVHPEWKDATEPEKYRYVHIKYFRTDARSEMRFKLFRQTFDENTIEKSSENKPEKVGVWEDMVFDLKTGKGNYENPLRYARFLRSSSSGYNGIYR